MELLLMLAGFAVVGGALYKLIRNRMMESIPEEFYRQFQGVNGPLAELSGKGKQIFKKVGREVSIRCALFERREPHKILMEARGKYEERAGTLNRNGTVDVGFGGVKLSLELQDRRVTARGPEGVLGVLDLDTGVIENIGFWDMKHSLKGPDGSTYDALELQGKNLYLCTRGAGKLFYSPLVAGDTEGLTESQQHLVVCLAALWNGVLGNN